MTLPLHIAIVGAGPVGLAAACALARALPRAWLQLFDAQTIDGQGRQDARTLALSLGSIQWLRRIGQWPAAAAAEPMTEVSVSQVAPGRADVRLRAGELGVELLGAVLSYGDLVQAQQLAWLALAEAEPQRLMTRGSSRVQSLKPMADGSVELDAGVAERFDLVLQAEGGVFGEQPRKPWRRDYAQSAWVGTVQLDTAWPRGLAVERFTRDGPLAVLPLPDRAVQRRAAIVWCLPPDDEPGESALARLRALLPREAAGIAALETPLKAFPLGLNAEPQPLSGRVLRIGNAAQTLHPVAGQGLNLGLRDAHELVAQLRDASSLDAALRRCVRRRAPDRFALLATTDALARLFAVDAAPVTLAREAGLRLLQALPPLRHALARQLMFGWR
jgi:2-octaprenyl-6-methoxyphenol hydroxylase